MQNSTLKWPFIGNDHAFNFLTKSINSNNLAQSYIFSGISNVGKTHAAIHLAKILLCIKNSEIKPCDNCDTCKQINQKSVQHNDIYILKKESDKKNISIDQVRDFISNLNMSSFNNTYKIGIIKSAHHLNQNGFNALLKTLEEPKKQVIIILTTSSIQAIPKTILSRTQNLRFKPVNQDLIFDLLTKKHNCEKTQARNLSRMCLGKPAIAIKLLENKEFYSKYFENINMFLNFNTKNLNYRFELIENITTKKQTTQESSTITLKIIEAWQALIRDCLLINYSQRSLVQHSIIADQLELIQKNLSTQKLLNLNKILKNAKLYLSTNVNAKNVMEYIAINI